MGKSKLSQTSGHRSIGSDFKNQVYAWCQKIPQGKVATYGQLARLAGKPQASRAVGNFMKTNPNPQKIPCHRVVAADGALTGYSLKGGIQRKKQLLIKEGVEFKDEKVDMKKSRWKSN